MLLTEKQRDALGEVINIAFARTAASLSQLSGSRVLLDAPGIEVLAIDEVPGVLANFIKQEVVSVHQIFSGPVSGDALLMLNYEGAVNLTDLLCEYGLKPHTLDASAREALTEIGNILLNACLGVFGNLLHVHVSFSVPRLHLETLEALLRSLAIGREGLRYALVVYTSFRLRDSAVSGYLVIALNVASLDRLIQEAEAWEEKQV